MDTPKQKLDLWATSARRVLGVTALLAIVSASLAAEGGAHWSYAGTTGPEKWGTLEHDFGRCAVGKTQSPIDLQDSVAHKADLPPIGFTYKPVALRIVDNGHTIQIKIGRASCRERV